MKINHKHYILIIFALASFTLSIFGYVFIYNEIGKQVESYAHAKNEVNSQDTREKYEEDLLNLHTSTKVNRDKALSYIVKEDMLVSFIETVEKIGEDTKTDFELSSISNSDDMIKAKISADGSWVNIIKAITLIENLPYNIAIKNLSIFTSGSLDNGSALKVNTKKVPTTNIWKLSMDIEVLTIK